MKIIILGAGRVGYSVAESLVSERNDITVIDTDAARLEELQDRFDLRGVVGNGIDVQVLTEAGAQDTDLLIACAARDETNLVCCKIAQQLFGIPTRVARVRSTAFEQNQALLGPQGFAVDAIICPEASLTRYIRKLIEYPDSLQVREFAGGRACLSSVRARLGAPAVGMRIGDLRLHNPELGLRVVAIYRRFAEEPDRFILCDGATRIDPGDEVFVLAASEHLQQVLEAFHRPSSQPSRAVRRILMAGGGQVSLQLAQELARESGRFVIKIIEADAARCEQLAAALPSEVLVLHGSPTDEDLFADENVEQTDLFLALTDDDENNIMASLLAKRMGASRVLALINRRSYADLMHGTQIDIALSPAQAMLGEFLAHVRKGDVQAVHSLRRGVAEALEIVARGDRKSSKVVGRKVDELKLPPEVHIGLIIRGLPDTEDIRAQTEGVEPEVIIPRSHTVIESNDHVVFFLPNKRLVQDVERLFRVSATFF
ncbi:MAG: Trk system potassium transporter TrkA [Comamonas sp.]